MRALASLKPWAFYCQYLLHPKSPADSTFKREWIKWIGTASGAQVQYFDCPKIIVDQINMVQGFLPPQGRVESFYVPFYSDDTGSEKNVLFTFGKEYGDGGLTNIPEVKDDAGQAMEMDVVEAKYFKFLKK